MKRRIILSVSALLLSAVLADHADARAGFGGGGFHGGGFHGWGSGRLVAGSPAAERDGPAQALDVLVGAP